MLGYSEPVLTEQGSGLVFRNPSSVSLDAPLQYFLSCYSVSVTPRSLLVRFHLFKIKPYFVAVDN